LGLAETPVQIILLIAVPNRSAIGEDTKMLSRPPGTIIQVIKFFCTASALAATINTTADDGQHSTNAGAKRYTQRTLVSDVGAPPVNSDPNLINGWGVAFNANGVVWVAANGTAKSTLYDGSGKPQALVVSMANDRAPTGIVFSGSQDFQVGGNPSRFIFATEDGTIEAWAPPPPPGAAPTVTTTVADKSKLGANYKGLALGANGKEHLLYAADFRHARVDVFDSKFQPAKLAGTFDDPKLPAGFAPFGIQAINGDIVVTYAKQGDKGKDDVAGAGNGYVDIFDANGQLLRRFAARGALNSPWGIALAPTSFGRFGGRLLVGNFGDGHISAFDLASGEFKGQLRDERGEVLVVPGLWGLAFGNGVRDQSVDTLFFAAGPDDESHGAYGRIDPALSSSDDPSDNGDRH
jgi:uncharacterized protein (TIGR03118 family)